MMEKKKKIKPLFKEEMVAINVMVPVRVKDAIIAIGAGSPSKGLRLFCESFREELLEAAKNAKKAS